jgi:hypothetical protein
MRIKSHQRQIIFLTVSVLVILMAFWLRIYEIDRFPPGIHPDEAQQFLRQWRYAAGYGHPMFYEGAPEPFDAMMRGILGYFIGMTHFTMRYVSILLNVLACAATIGAAKMLFRHHPYRMTIAIFAGLILTTMPATVIIGRTMYRANQLILWTPMALWSVGRVWQTGKLRDAVWLGVTTALGTILYLAGPFLAISISFTLVLAPLMSRRYWIGFRNFIAYGVTVSLLMLPWLYLFLTIPAWLTSRLQDFSSREMGTQFVFDLSAFLDQFSREFMTFIQPMRKFVPTYNVQTSGFLNPVLVIFLMIGIIAILNRLIRHRDGRLLAIVLVLVGMMIPPSLTKTPEEVIRSVGVFAPLALITAFGVGAVLAFLRRWLPKLMPILLIALFVGSVAYTYLHTVQHYARFEDTDRDGMFFTVLHEQVLDLFASETPLYIPMEYLNFRTSASYFRPDVTVRPYAGEDLPSGDIIALFDSWYGTPLANKSQGYGLYLPTTHEIVILPPVQPENRQMIEATILEQGEQIIGSRGDWLYTRLSLTENDPFFTSRLLPHTVERETPLVVFDDNLELLDVVVPESLNAGDWNSVTLYWRLREPTAVDYYANLQLWRNTGAIESFGRSFEQHNHIYSDLAPTPSWQAGEIYTQEKFVFVFDDIPDGGYQWVLNGYSQPNDLVNPMPAPMTINSPALPIQNLVAVARSWVNEPETIDADNPISVDVIFDETVRLQHLTLDPPLSDIQAGDLLTIRLYWDVIAPPQYNAIVYLHIKDESDNLIAQQDREPLSNFRMDTWQTGQQIMSTHQIQLPADTIPHNLSLGMYRFDVEGNIVPLGMSENEGFYINLNK